MTEETFETTVKLLPATYVREVRVPKAGSAVPKHEHEYDHISVLVRGKVLLYVNERLAGEYTAPAAVLIRGGQRHAFLALADDTVWLCVHDAERGVEED